MSDTPNPSQNPQNSVGNLIQLPTGEIVAKPPAGQGAQSHGAFVNAQKTRRAQTNDNGEEAFEIAREARDRAEQTREPWDAVVADMAQDNADATPLGRAQKKKAAQFEQWLAELENRKAGAQPRADEDDGLNHRDPWDNRDAATQYDPSDPFAPFREGRGVPLEMPSSVMDFSDEDQANLTDFGVVAAREGWSPEFAQALVDQAAVDFGTEDANVGPEGYDPDRTVTELRWEWGGETEAILARVEAYCARRPALSAYLDSTGLGNSPAIVRMLAAVASDEAIVTKEGAKAFIDGLGKNEAYWQGSKLELAKSRIAFMLSDGK